MTAGNETWILESVLYMPDFSIYPVTVQGIDTGKPYMNEEDMEWILINIYNFSPEAIEKARQEAPPHVYQDGQYYLLIGAGSMPYAANIQPASNGKYYYVSYNIGWSLIGESEPKIDEKKHYALLEYKIIDGKGYWSIYKDTVNSSAIKVPRIN